MKIVRFGKLGAKNSNDCDMRSRLNSFAKITSIKGKSLVWNQLVQNGDFSDGTTGWSTNKVVISASDGVLSVTATQAFGWCVKHIEVIPGHKYLYRSWAKLSAASTKTSVVLYDVDAAATLQNTPISSTTDFEMSASIFTPAGTDLLLELGRDTASSGWVTSYHKDVILIDLTLLFGSGYEPATVEEFETLYSLDYYANNPGQIISNKTEAIEVVGFNQWDEVWELGGFYADGSSKTSTSEIRTKNFIPVLQNTTYYLKTKAGISQGDVHFYDANKVHLSGAWSKGNNTFITPSGCMFIKIAFQSGYGTTYNHDICINISSTRNGEYEPYHKTTIPLNIPTITGKLNGEGESVVVFPNGMRSAGSVYDEIVGNKAIVRLAEVDLGDLNWVYDKGSQGAFSSTSLQSTIGANSAICSKYVCNLVFARPASMSDKQLAVNKAPGNTSGYFNLGEVIVKDSAYTDAATFKAAMAGVKLIYELATPEEYILDTPIPVKYKVENGGVQRRLPEDTAAVVLAPFVGTFKYSPKIDESTLHYVSIINEQ